MADTFVESLKQRRQLHLDIAEQIGALIASLQCAEVATEALGAAQKPASQLEPDAPPARGPYTHSGSAMDRTLALLKRADGPMHIVDIMKELGPKTKRTSLQATLDREDRKTNARLRRVKGVKATYELVR